MKKLQHIGKLDKFPARFRNQQDIARSLLVGTAKDNDVFALQYIDKKVVQWHQKKGYVYFFRYKPGKDDDWQMGISGLQPLDLREVNNEGELVQLTNKKIRADQSQLEQFDNQLKRLLFSRLKGAMSFYLENDYSGVKDDEE